MTFIFLQQCIIISAEQRGRSVLKIAFAYFPQFVNRLSVHLWELIEGVQCEMSGIGQ